MKSVSKSHNINNFYERIAVNMIPRSSTLTYDGLMNTYYYPIQFKETNQEFNVELSFNNIISPIDNREETFLGCLIKSKYDGVGARNKPIDVVVILDISGSMSKCLGRSKDSCLSLAKKAIIKLTKKLNECDRIGLCTFNDKAYKIFDLQSVKEIENMNSRVNEITTQGGTNLFNGLNEGLNIMKAALNKSNEKRLLFLTDMNDMTNKQFTDLINSAAKEEIFTSIIGIGMGFNTELTQRISKNKGVKYFSATEENHLNEIIVDDFEYNFFPTGFDVTVEFKSGQFKLKKCIGTGYKEVDNLEDKNEWKTSTHQLNDSEFRRNVNFLLLFFNRINKRFPKPILAECCNFMKYNKKTIAKIDTSFPSPLKLEENGTYLMKGGMILLKLEKEKYREEDSIKTGLFSIRYLEGESGLYKNLSFPFRINLSNFEELKSLPIKRGMCLYYYAKFLRRIMKIKNNEYKDSRKFSKEYLQKENLGNLKKSIYNYISENEDDKSICNELIKKIDKIISLI